MKNHASRFVRGCAFLGTLEMDVTSLAQSILLAMLKGDCASCVPCWIIAFIVGLDELVNLAVGRLFDRES